MSEVTNCVPHNQAPFLIMPIKFLTVAGANGPADFLEKMICHNISNSIMRLLRPALTWNGTRSWRLYHPPLPDVTWTESAPPCALWTSWLEGEMVLALSQFPHNPQKLTRPRDVWLFEIFLVSSGGIRRTMTNGIFVCSRCFRPPVQNNCWCHG